MQLLSLNEFIDNVIETSKASRVLSITRNILTFYYHVPLLHISKRGKDTVLEIYSLKLYYHFHRLFLKETFPPGGNILPGKVQIYFASYPSLPGRNEKAAAPGSDRETYCLRARGVTLRSAQSF